MSLPASPTGGLSAAPLVPVAPSIAPGRACAADAVVCPSYPGERAPPPVADAAEPSSAGAGAMRALPPPASTPLRVGLRLPDRDAPLEPIPLEAGTPWSRGDREGGPPAEEPAADEPTAIGGGAAVATLVVAELPLPPLLPPPPAEGCCFWACGEKNATKGAISASYASREMVCSVALNASSREEPMSTSGDTCGVRGGAERREERVVDGWRVVCVGT